MLVGTMENPLAIMYIITFLYSLLSLFTGINLPLDAVVGSGL